MTEYKEKDIYGKEYNKLNILYPTYQNMIDIIDNDDIENIKKYLNYLSNRNINKLFMYLLENNNVNYEYVKLFLEAGANPNFYQDNSFPLKTILFKHPLRIDLINLLLQYGANIKMVDLYGYTILSYCNIHKKTDIINYLNKISFYQ
jgi:ankyrin repeat protein